MIDPQQVMGMPPSVLTYMEGLDRDLGADVTAERVGMGHWKITAERGEWLVTVTVAALRRGRVQQKASSLYRNGYVWPKADTYSDLITLFTAEQPEEPEVEVPIDEAPAAVRHSCTELGKLIRAVPRNWQTTVVRQGRHWTARATSDRVRVEIHGDKPPMDRRKPGREAGIVASDPWLRIYIDGEDYTEKLNGRADRIGAVVREAIAHVPPPAGTGRTDATSTGVAVRKQVVMRN